MSNDAQPIPERGLSQIPDALRERTRHHVTSLAEFLTDELDPRLRHALPRVLASSEFVARTLTAYPDLLTDLSRSGDVMRAFTAHDMRQHLSEHLRGAADDADLKRRLRIFRRREAVRIAIRDLAGFADLAEVMATMSALADACIHGALDLHFAWAKHKSGVPIGESGNEASLIVIGMGKLGGQELNFSSDVDLIFAYTEEGEVRTSGHAGLLSNHEFFVQLGQALINTLAQPTGDGYVFRVDMRLRPDGASGPLALSFDAIEQYYQTQGRDWERYALIKARIVGGDVDVGNALLSTLQPFVFRKYLDYGALDAIRSMKGMIEREIERKGMREHVKLGPGGIREIEFIGQAMQLLRAGREPPLQCRAILDTLERLAQRDYLPQSARDELANAYIFLRNVEHRLQMVADEQTHVLPRDTLERERIAFSMNFPDWQGFETELDAHRQRVHRHFVHTFVLPQPESETSDAGTFTGVWLGTVDKDAASTTLQSIGFSDGVAAAELLNGFRDSASIRALSTDGRQRLDKLMPLLIAAVSKVTDPQVTLAQVINVLESIGRRTTYFVMLAESPMALTQFVKLCAASKWIAHWIARHPIVLDELLDPRTLYEPPTQDQLTAELRSRVASLREDDLELQLEVLREFHHSHVLRVAATDIGPGLPVERVGAQLAGIADVVLQECLAIAWNTLTARHGEPRGPGKSAPAGFTVIAYGKHGSCELGYASDLDMIFLYEGCEEGVTDGTRSLTNEEFFARLSQRLIHLLTTRTPSGVLYEVDTRLRPSGKSGTLVTSLTAFRDYQKTQAWTWEHQALVRARAVAGPPGLQQAFADVRREILGQSRDEERLKREVREMRERMAAGHPEPASGFDLKHSRGGIVDIEFMVQYWILRWAQAHPALIHRTDNISILESLRTEGLLDSEQSALLTDAYRRYLSTEHRLKLAERGSVTDGDSLGEFPHEVRRIWDETFT